MEPDGTIQVDFRAVISLDERLIARRTGVYEYVNVRVNGGEVHHCFFREPKTLTIGDTMIIQGDLTWHDASFPARWSQLTVSPTYASTGPALPMVPVPPSMPLWERLLRTAACLYLLKMAIAFALRGL